MSHLPGCESSVAAAYCNCNSNLGPFWSKSLAAGIGVHVADKNVRIPAQLPTHEKAVDLFIKWRDEPSSLLRGLTPLSLFAGLMIDIDRVWFTGSCVWYPAVLGKKFPDKTDIDIVFYTEDQCRTFCERLQEVMKAHDPKGTYTLEDNKHHGAKFLRNGDAFLDTWWLPTGQSIAEHVMGFQFDHERVALMAGARTGDVAALTRIVRPIKYVSLQVKADEETDDYYGS